MKEDNPNQLNGSLKSLGFPKEGFNNPTFVHDETPEKESKSKKKDKKKKKEQSKEEKKLVGLLELFQFADGLDIFLMIVGFICALGHGIALPIMIIVFGEMTDAFVQSGTTANMSSVANSSVTHNVSVGSCQIPGIDIEKEMTRYAYYFTAIGFSAMVLATFQVTTYLISARRQSQRIRQKFFHAVLHQEMSWFDTHEIGTLNTRLTDGINTIHEGLGDKICIFVQFFAMFIAGFIIGFVFGWKLTLVILAVSPLLAISAAFATKFLATLTSKEQTAYAKAGAVAEEVLTAIRTVVAFGGQQKAVAKYEANLLDAKSFGVKKALTTDTSMGVVQFCIFGSYALAFWYGTKLAVDEPENYSIGRVITVFFSVLIGVFSLGQAAPNLESIANARGAAYEVYKIIVQPRLIDSSSKDGYKPDSVKGDIEFKNVHFSYPSRPDIPILRGLDLTIQSGKTIALVGSSGCGKSTTVQLIQRFYDPLQGEVTIDGRDIRTLNVKWLREHVGVVSQEPILFAATIAENIRYGRDDVTDAEIEKATKEANAYDFISRLPDKLNTMVGERGAQLSGGQKQRIAIARALVRNPKILLLDEATSALDTQSESIVQAALDKARTGRTTIVVAHRLSTIRTADVIAGFQNGVIVEQGTHSQLMTEKGVYYNLVMQQSKEHEHEYEETDNELESETDISDQDADEINEIESEIIRRNSVRRQSSRASTRRRKSAKKPKKEQKVKVEEKVEEVPFSRVLAMNKPEWPYIIMGIFASLIAGGVYPAVGIIFAKIIGVFSEPDPTIKSQRTVLFSLIFLLLGFISLVAYFVKGFMYGRSGESLTMRIRAQSFKAVLRQEIGFFDDHQNAVGVLTTRLATDASQVQGATGIRLGLMATVVCSLVAALIVGFVFSWQLTLLILACFPLLAAANFIRTKSMGGHASRDQKALEEAGRISTEAVENIRTLVSLTREETFYKKYSDSLDGPYRDALKKAPIHGITYALAQTINFFVNAAVFRFGAWLIAHCLLNFENMYIVFSTIVFTAMNIGQTSSFAPDQAKAKVSAYRIIKLLERKPEIDSYSEEGEKPNRLEGNVEFRDVKFVYPTRKDVTVLQGLSVKVGKGQTLALVGSSGCGKSTSVQLLERFYDPAGGQVLIDGKDSKTLNIQWLRSQMGIVSQEPMLFDCSIAENIQYGDNSRIISQEEIEAAAVSANIHKFIDDLPDKYNTRVGDKGAQLSGGQKQRIAIARALVRNPKILLLDEATSALDTESEKIVQEALDKAREGRTCIVIAHRLSTVQNADIIAVIHNGKVAELGTHSQLLAQEGLYYALVNAQVAH
ncbi:ATP-dependent translocase ABCB1-like [Protopterus annectens]|uniref:ATP-dependent translocase ABCB1-like n=1 Tax=Protopterus annectens TaxID=7888 RepID=UPI001CFBD778|nr:ATP-dependent translocase ABCB1-like [Protopterus annectens]